MPSDRDMGSLSTNQWDRLHGLVNQFEEALRKDSTVDLGNFLLPEGDPHRLLLLHELIISDLDHQWREGRPVVLESYVKQYPEMGPPGELPPKLIFEEYWVRQRNGDRPPLESYQKRFPDQFEEVHRLVQETSSPTNMVTPISSVPAPKSAKPVSQGSNISIGGGYKLIEVLGEGQFGKVWKAEAPGGKMVAVKVISWPGMHPATLRERQSLELIKQLNHPYLLDIHFFEYSEESDRLIIVMALADCNLRDRLKACRKEGHLGIPAEELLIYMKEAAEALDYLHSNGVHHRDIKPGNILLTSNHVKVGDLGLARVIESQKRSDASILGTPPYMPPETLLGEIHPNSDQYSLAVSYIELRRGKCPFKRGEPKGIKAKHLEDDPQLAPLTDAEKEILIKAGKQDPEARYSSCKAFVEALEETLLPKKSSLGYKKRKLIGRGTFGEVWQGEAPGNIPVAIKVIPLADQEKAQSELDALELIKNLDHPNLVRIFAFWIEEDQLHIAMDLADCSLRTKLNDYRKNRDTQGIPLEKLIHYTYQSALALDDLHKEEVVHRDIKPENILLKGDRIKVADFGLARMLESQQFSATTSGTLPYMPPEVWEGKTSIHSDQYSLAATYVELRLGHHLFQVDSYAQAYRAHAQQSPDLSELTPGEKEVLKKAVAKNPEDRFPSCRAFAEALIEATSVHLPKSDTLSIPTGDTLVRSGGTITPDGLEDQHFPTLVPDDFQSNSPGKSAVWKQSGPVSTVSEETKKESKGKLLWVAVLLLVVVAVAWPFAANWFPSPVKTKSIQLELPVLNKIYAGEKQTLSLRVGRENWDEPIQLSFSEVSDVTLPECEIPRGKESISIPIIVKAHAFPGKRVLKITAKSEDLTSTKELNFQILPLKTLPISNAGTFEKPVIANIKTIDGKNYYDKIDCYVPDMSNGKIKVRFLLIDPEGGEDPFYIMENMVWNKLFNVFTETSGNKLENERWKSGPIKQSPGQKPRNISYLEKDGKLPVMRVSVMDAQRFAQWLGGKGGKLPSLEQWKEAAGYYVYKKKGIPKGPYDVELDKKLDSGTVTTEDIGVNLMKQGPLEVGVAKLDVSPKGCRDMGGNGYEWTRTIVGAVGNVDDFSSHMDANVYFTSQSYFIGAFEPFRFENFDDPESYFFYRKVNSSDPKHEEEIGFRIVIE